jgi:FkbM family methyltransferase
LLVANTANFANVYTVRAALWTETCSVLLFNPGTGEWAFRLAEAADVARQAGHPNVLDYSAVSVPAVTLSDIIRDYALANIGLLKLDIEGSEKELFEHADAWIANVDAICLELHDRFKPGCSRAFYKAIDEFPTEIRRGEDVLVIRDSIASLQPV